jgi:serine/threonine-protein kinase
VIHRNVRPENVIVPHRGAVKLVNFDCAQVAGLTTVRARVSRRLDQRYAAPEVWQDAGAASPASDQYAAGVLLFELLTGQPPYQKIKRVFSTQGLPRTPTQVNPDLPPEVDEVLARMCAFQPAERYENMAQVIEDLAIIS